MTPVRGVLLALLLGAAGFLAGVEVEKGQMTSGSTGARSGRGAGGGGAALAAAQGGGGAPGGPARGLNGQAGGGFAGRGGAGAGGATIGSVSTVQGATLYVADLNGNTIKVVTSDGSQVSKTVSSTVRAIHPGDAVVVFGTKGSDGSVTAAQIRLTPAAGAGGSGGLGSLFGGGGASSSGSGGAGGGGSGGAGGGGGGGSLRGLFGG